MSIIKFLTNTPWGYIIIYKNSNSRKKAENMECKRKKKREEEEMRTLINRLSRIEGQVRGVKGMVESDAYCVDIITQVSAIQSALSSFSKELLASHIRTCVVEDIKSDREGAVEELIKTVEVIKR